MAYKQPSPIIVAEGGTGAATLTDGGIVLGSGTAAVTVTAQPTNGQILIGSTGVDPVLGSLTSTGSSLTVSAGAGTLNVDIAPPVSIANGGTGATTLTDHGILVGSGTSAITALAVGTDGQLCIGSSAADPVFATVTSTDSLLTLTGGAGSLDIVAQNAVSAAAALTDNLVVRGDGGTRGTQTSTVSITDNGEMTNASQPAFLVFSPGETDVTGNGTLHTLSLTNEIYDQNGDFASSTFTSPVTGKYPLSFSVSFSGLGGTASVQLQTIITTSNRGYQEIQGTLVTISDNNCGSMTVCADMDAADTAVCKVQMTGLGADDADISAAPYTNFSGFLAC